MWLVLKHTLPPKQSNSDQLVGELGRATRSPARLMEREHGDTVYKIRENERMREMTERTTLHSSD
jgi:hypothetical protein